MSVATHKVRTDDGISIAYTVRGDGPRTLLFLHGWGGSGSGFFWNEMLTHLDLTGLRAGAACAHRSAPPTAQAARYGQPAMRGVNSTTRLVRAASTTDRAHARS
jgi:predicted esterase